MNSGPVTPEMTGSFVYFSISALHGRKSAYTSSFVVLEFGNALENCTVDGRIRSGNET